MNQLYKSFLVLMFIGFIAQGIKAQVNIQDSLALVDIFNATNGQLWTVKNNWLTKQPVNKWYGITVDSTTGRVVAIYLKNNNLVGSIPPSIGNLTGLTLNLRLENNKLSGNIPPSIGNLTGLEQLGVSGNQLFGTIPTTIGNLTNLVYLDLSFNKFSGGIPASIGSLALLTNLFFNSNNLSGSIPATIGNMNSLEYFYADYNQLTDSVPAVLGNLSNLLILSLSSNNFIGNIPQALGKLNNLITLDLGLNQLSGSIPATLGSLAKLNSLSLQYNRLTGNIPTEIGNLKNLTVLNLNNNQLSSAIPASLAGLSGLSNFPIQNNRFTFAGMEAIANMAVYSPQADVLLKQNANTFSVSVGGTAANNTYQWYKDGSLVSTIFGDSTYTAKANGKYWVLATNAIANQLTLRSDSVRFTSLPVTSINLKVQAINGYPLLQWQTINEINTVLFDVERSTDGKDYVIIYIKNAIGSGNNSYHFVDETLSSNPAKNFYYRIKTTDKDGNFYYSNVATDQLSIDNYQLSIYPNPAKEKITIHGKGISIVEIINSEGKLIKKVELDNATNPLVALNGLTRGVYQLIIQTNGLRQTIKLVKE